MAAEEGTNPNLGLPGIKVNCYARDEHKTLFESWGEKNWS